MKISAMKLEQGDVFTVRFDGWLVSLEITLENDEVVVAVKDENFYGDHRTIKLANRVKRRLTTMHVPFAVHIESGMVYKMRKTRATDPSPSDIMEPSPVLKFKIDYPLTNPKEVELTHENGKGWTRQEFVDAVRSAYVEIYAAEADPGRAAPNLLNRGRSEGPHGIWGHDLADLVLEGAEKKGDDCWELIVGS